MSRNKQADGTKIAQAAKDLNVTSVTIRRYLTEFNIETMSDENGIKVLPAQAMDELQEVRRLKEDGMTNPKVMEFLEERRTKSGGDAKAEKPKARAKAKVVESKPITSKARKVEEVEEEEDEEEVAPVRKVAAAKPVKKPTARRVTKAEVVEAEEVVAPVAAELTEAGDSDDESSGDESEAGDDNRSKHSLTCQTCGKVFEHMNPRLRDCLDCYRAKRKERRRGGADRHKNVIQHPLAQQAAAKAPSAQAAELAASASSAPAPRQRDFSPAASSAPAQAPSRERDKGADRERSFDRDRGVDRDKGADREREREFIAAPAPSSTPLVQRGPVRNYRKAIEETRQITGSLKRRLERPDLPEGERRWLEQIYAYQLILHQGWRHLAEYKSAGQNQSGRTED
jgi:DNA-binding transcriptional MerR regulator